MGGSPTPENGSETCLTYQGTIENWEVEDDGTEIVNIEYPNPDIEWGAQACIGTS